MADDGDMFAGVFVEERYEEAKVVAKTIEKRRAESGIDDNGPIHYLTNILIEPTAEGAMGVAYHLGMARDTPEKGVYHDQLVKTPEGWRFKERKATFGAFSDELLQALEQ